MPIQEGCQHKVSRVAVVQESQQLLGAPGRMTTACIEDDRYNLLGGLVGGTVGSTRLLA